MKQELQMPLRTLSRRLELGYSSLRRWRMRCRLGQPLLRKPGPKKLEPLPMETLQQEIAGLKHGARRTGGTGALYRHFEVAISRRDLNKMIEQSRIEALRHEREARQCVEWRYPGLCWAMDTTEWARDGEGCKLLVHGAQDLCSRYHFEPWVDVRNRGVDIATWLENLFRARPAPLILKRDNGSPLNHPAVDAVLARHGVIPLNSPPNYPRYNGGKERGFRELKERLGVGFMPSPLWVPSQHRIPIALALHELNHQLRPCLQGRTACAVESVKHHSVSRHERQAIFNSIFKDFRETISCNMDDEDHPCRTKYWRLAVESWLRRHDLIRVFLNNNKKV